MSRPFRSFRTAPRGWIVRGRRIDTRPVLFIGAASVRGGFACLGPVPGVKPKHATAATNDLGIASLSPSASPDLVTDGTAGRLAAFVDIPRMSPRLKAKVERNTGVAFAFTASGAQFTVKVTVAGAGPDAAQFDLVNRVIKELEKNNVRANQQQSRYEFHLVVTASEGQTVAGMGGNLYTQKVQVSGMLKDGSTGTIVGTLTASSVGMDKDRDRALEKGIAGLKFPSKDLSSIVARAREQ